MEHIGVFERAKAKGNVQTGGPKLGIEMASLVEKMEGCSRFGTSDGFVDRWCKRTERGIRRTGKIQGRDVKVAVGKYS